MKSNISGFPEYTPSEQLAFDDITAKIRTIYQSFGYVPLETAAVERIDTLTSKGIDSKEVYALRRLNAQGDDGDKDIALRFDLTVPLARYVAQNYSDLVFPFRRYQCQPVWRGERAQKGRYRQFHQFDLDIIGDGKLSLEADAEVIAAARSALIEILPPDTEFMMAISNRKLLQGILDCFGIYGENAQYSAIKIIDNLEKVSRETTIEGLLEFTSVENAENLFDVLTTNPTSEKLHELNLSEIGQVGLEEVDTVMTTLMSLIEPNTPYGQLRVTLDPRIARGLDYYTGTVVETRLHAAPELGSICSGGRYDNLTASLSERNLPGVGVSIGISRLAAWLMEQAPYNAMPATTAKVIVTGPNAATICQHLRSANPPIPCELALGDKSAGQHFQTAQKRGIAYGIVADESGLSLRVFADRSSIPLEESSLIPYLQTVL